VETNLYKKKKPKITDPCWILVTGIYQKGKIICNVPQLVKEDIISLDFEVDISINGT